MGELGPGSTPRRWIPEGGEQKLRDRIHKESKFTDDHKNLEHTFSKPQRSKSQRWFRCLECGHETSAPKNTVMIVCKGCKNACKVELINE